MNRGQNINALAGSSPDGFVFLLSNEYNVVRFSSHPQVTIEWLRIYSPGVNTMGLFWDLLQQSQISDHSNRADTLEERVADLEIELSHTRKTLHEVLARLERIIGEDIGGDGQIG